MLEEGASAFEGSIFNLDLEAVQAQVAWQINAPFQNSCHLLTLALSIEG